MSTASFPVTSAPAHLPARGFGALTRCLLVVVVLCVAGSLLATAMSDRTADSANVPRLAPPSPSQPAVAATGSTTVPDASAVFSGREIGIEAPAPTF